MPVINYSPMDNITPSIKAITDSTTAPTSFTNTGSNNTVDVAKLVVEVTTSISIGDADDMAITWSSFEAVDVAATVAIIIGGRNDYFTGRCSKRAAADRGTRGETVGDGDVGEQRKETCFKSYGGCSSTLIEKHGYCSSYSYQPFESSSSIDVL